MSPTPARARVIREVSNKRVTQRVNDQSDHERKADQVSANPHHLAIKDQEEVIKPIAFYAKGHRAKTVGNFSTDTHGAIIAHFDS